MVQALIYKKSSCSCDALWCSRATYKKDPRTCEYCARLKRSLPCPNGGPAPEVIHAPAP